MSIIPPETGEPKRVDVTLNDTCTWYSPAVDMYQTNDEVVVKAAVPGFKADEVQINVTGDVLTLKGELKREDEKTSSSKGKDRSWQMREQRWDSFERSISFPTGVVADRAQADFENGILTITLPKSEEVKARTITVRAK